LAKAKKTKKHANQVATVTPKEAAFVEDYKERKANSDPRIKYKVESQEGKTVRLSHDHKSDDNFFASAANAFGSCDQDFIDMGLQQASNMIPSQEFNINTINGILSALGGIAPRDEIEALLASQMIAVHFASIEATKRAAALDTSPELRSMNLKHAGQLMRTYTQQMKALDRHRGKEQQRVKVEHVHVYHGGHAIVGKVEREG
jgi:hypothetical protein